METPERYDNIEDLIPYEELVRRYKLILNDIAGVHTKDKIGIRSMLEKFGSAGVDVGIGFKQAYGAAMSGDSFQLFVLHDDIFLFVFSDVSGHGLEAYTTYIKLRSAIILAVRTENERHTANPGAAIDYCSVIHNIIDTFTNIMEDSISRDFACVIFAFVSRDDDAFTFRFFNRGMYYPHLSIINDDGSVSCFNLNEKSESWTPSKGSPLGSDFRKIMEAKYYICAESSITLPSGGRLCFFTDGITEATNMEEPPVEYGISRLERILTETCHYFPQAAINILYDDVYYFMKDPSRQLDDMTAVIFDVPGKKGERSV
ncbi:MAG: PP2C family protein-serine/threonine phosphatase [Spirochaetota bacterium]